MATYEGSCHCGAVRFSVDGSMDRVVECNCSICRRKGYLHWIVPRDAVRVVAGEDALATYRFGTMVAQHHFCRTCGVTPFYVPRSHPHDLDVNVRCLDGVALESLDVQSFDGRHWEESVAALRAGDRPGESR
jgi:hypothetical protein